eukprot:CAMPEP_0179437548 /NCGR_PEP_ID=MMETSP0799-20121207/21425_1 /TAXON_ID=46947 /ORGANISM="Geminigera cryophila, Strain CCMP2564" /LENGTH=324 /DNA_ID=CAMNT_0021218563 /DNA_START=81 /DNA_END=1055 /DNA_ORIENTATION=+
MNSPPGIIKGASFRSADEFDMLCSDDALQEVDVRKGHFSVLPLPSPLTEIIVQNAMAELSQGACGSLDQCIACYRAKTMSAEDMLTCAKMMAPLSKTFAALFQKLDLAQPSAGPAASESPDAGEEASADDMAFLFALSCPTSITPLDLFKVNQTAPKSPPKSPPKRNSLRAEVWGPMLLTVPEDEDIPEMQLGPVAICSQHQQNTREDRHTISWEEEIPTHDFVDSLCEDSHLLHVLRSESHPGLPICWSVPSDSALAWVGVGLVCFFALATSFLYGLLASLPALGLILMALVLQADSLVVADAYSALVTESHETDNESKLLQF